MFNVYGIRDRIGDLKVIIPYTICSCVGCYLINRCVKVVKEIYFCINEGDPITQVCNQLSETEHVSCTVLWITYRCSKYI